jgi:LuxR family maltose regulon positive regulatory protein
MACGAVETLTTKDQFDLALRAEVATIEATIAGFDDESERAFEFGQIASDSRVAISPWVRRFSEAAKIFGLLYGGRSDEVERIRLDVDATKTHDHEPLYAGVYRTSMFGLNSLVSGKLPEATARFESALTYAENAVGPDSTAAALPSGYLSLLYYEANDLAGAQRIIDARLGTTFDECPLGSILRYCYTASRLHVCNGEFGPALQVLEHGREIAQSRDWLRLRAACDAEEVRICLDLGWVNRAQETAETLSTLISSQPPKPTGSFLETWASWCTLNARLDLSLGKTDRAIRSLGKLKDELLQGGMAYLAARTSIILVIALHQDGAHDDAFAVLAEALRYAQVNRMIRSFIDEGQPLRQLLTKFQESAQNQQGIDVEFTDTLINTPDIPATQLEHTDSMNAKALLSSRELEILNHIGHGLSNKEIARALRIAPETVKWHLKNIFEKLQVSTRLEAIQRGLGIPRALRRE